MLPGDKEDSGTAWCETWQFSQSAIVIFVWYHKCWTAVDNVPH